MNDYGVPDLIWINHSESNYERAPSLSTIMAARVRSGTARLPSKLCCILDSTSIIAMPNGQTITLLLRELAGGEKQAFDQLIPLVYAELRRIAEARLRSERPGHTFQPTDLVHEVYARMALVVLSPVRRSGPLFGEVAGYTMRKILWILSRACATPPSATTEK